MEFTVVRLFGVNNRFYTGRKKKKLVGWCLVCYGFRVGRQIMYETPQFESTLSS